MTPDLKQDILKLYPEYNRVYGPYISKADERSRVVLVGQETKTTRLLGKVVLEVKLERRLSGNETVDHKDNNKKNDHKDNLQVLTRQENAKKSSEGNKYCLGYKQPEEHKRNGEKNGQAALKNEDVLRLRVQYNKKEVSKKEICQQTGLKERTVRNILNGVSYMSAGGPIAPPAKVGRPSLN